MKYLLISLLGFLPLLLSAQSDDQKVIASAGSDRIAGGIHESYTVGEVVTQTLEVSAQILTQGFHQTNLLITSIESSDNTLALDVNLYPNPAQNEIRIDWDHPTATLNLRLFDLAGKTLLEQNQLSSSGTPVDVTALPVGYYLLQVTSDQLPGAQAFRVQVLR